MTKILSKEIENLSPEIENEILKYLKNLRTSNAHDSNHRMTLDRFQNDEIQYYDLREQSGKTLQSIL